MANQPITWQKSNTFRPVDVLKSIRMKRRRDLSDSQCGVVVGARCAGLSILQSADRLGFSQHHNRRVYRGYPSLKNISKLRLRGGKCYVDVRVAGQKGQTGQRP